ncbi:MAG TPA: hypothetical protein VGL09_07435 [Methylomirabilota bacterium]
MKNAFVVVALLTVVAGSAHAEHLTLAPEARGGGATWPGLDLEFRLGDGGFRLGGRMLGERGAYGAWLSGHVAADGFVLDGHVQEPDKDHHLTLDSRKLEALLQDALRGLDGF